MLFSCLALTAPRACHVSSPGLSSPAVAYSPPLAPPFHRTAGPPTASACPVPSSCLPNCTFTHLNSAWVEIVTPPLYTWIMVVWEVSGWDGAGERLPTPV